MPETSRFGLALRLAFFFALELVGLYVYGILIYSLFGYLAAGALGTFCAAVTANAIVVRIYERGRLEDVGMGWTELSKRHVLLGLAVGAGAAIAVVGLPMLVGVASMTRDTSPDAGFAWDRLAFLGILLLFGAVGEELLFRGYGFQVLMGVLGTWPAILTFGALFAVMHRLNLDAAGIDAYSSTALLALLNTFLWGLLLGVAIHRSGDLWLPIGLHFGWNIMLPLFGVRLSGFTMGVTGFELHWSAGSLWSGGAYGPEASVLTTVAILVCGFLLYRLRIQAQTLVLVESRRERGA